MLTYVPNINLYDYNLKHIGTRGYRRLVREKILSIKNMRDD